MARFSAIPELPDSFAEDWQAPFLGAMAENVALLVGTRGEVDGASQAIPRGDITVNALGLQSMHTTATAEIDGFITTAGDEVAGLAAFRQLRTDVQKLANDLFLTRRALDALLAQMKV